MSFDKKKFIFNLMYKFYRTKLQNFLKISLKMMKREFYKNKEYQKLSFNNDFNCLSPSAVKN